MAWYRKGSKPLSEPMLTGFIDAYMRHYRGWRVKWTPCSSNTLWWTFQWQLTALSILISFAECANNGVSLAHNLQQEKTIKLWPIYLMFGRHLPHVEDSGSKDKKNWQLQWQTKTSITASLDIKSSYVCYLGTLRSTVKLRFVVQKQYSSL